MRKHLTGSCGAWEDGRVATASGGTFIPSSHSVGGWWRGATPSWCSGRMCYGEGGGLLILWWWAVSLEWELIASNNFSNITSSSWVTRFGKRVDMQRDMPIYDTCGECWRAAGLLTLATQYIYLIISGRTLGSASWPNVIMGNWVKFMWEEEGNGGSNGAVRFSL